MINCSIQSATIYDYLQYMISDNIRVYNMRSLAIYDYIQIYPVSEGYLRKILVERRGKYPERGTFDCPRNRYFSKLSLTNSIYLLNSAEYLTASKTVACKQAQNFRPPRSFDFQMRIKINLRKQEKSFQRSV